MIKWFKEIIEILIKCLKNASNPQKMKEYMELQKKANELRKQQINEEYERMKKQESNKE